MRRGEPEEEGVGRRVLGVGDWSNPYALHPTPHPLTKSVVRPGIKVSDCGRRP